ncbi:LOW QUALITY PROTEIN: hypothetical protein V1477_004452 [Vespula maculifrons]|uniref:Uncharacterized protein n=1 Tax=Vespula maculifrons TaxID=7453 RepID=A0ABD2CSY0_VESMC
MPVTFVSSVQLLINSQSKLHSFFFILLIQILSKLVINPVKTTTKAFTIIHFILSERQRFLPFMLLFILIIKYAYKYLYKLNENNIENTFKK